MLHGLGGSHKVMQRITELLKPGSHFISITPCMKEKMTFLSKLQLPFFLLLMKLGFLPNILIRFKFNESANLVTSKIQTLKNIENVGDGYYGELLVRILGTFDIIGSYQRLDDFPESGSEKKSRFPTCDDAAAVGTVSPKLVCILDGWRWVLTGGCFAILAPG